MMIVADMRESSSGNQVESEKTGDYTVKYAASGGSQAIPEQAQSILKKYKGFYHQYSV